jgi:glycerophosphoryl diester phosphodiesterase
MIMSLEYAGIKKIRELRPDWIIGLLSAQAIGDLTRLDADFLAVSTRLANSSFIRSAQAAGKQVYVWTVNDALAMSQLMSLGVDGVITDEPRLGREVLAIRTRLSSVERLLLQMAFLFGQEIPFIPEQ